jgi:hypothetical protein
VEGKVQEAKLLGNFCRRSIEDARMNQAARHPTQG